MDRSGAVHRPPRRVAGDRPRVRVRQRLPRHGQRRGDGDLHQVAAALAGGRSGRASATSAGSTSAGRRSPSAIVNLLPVDLLVSVGSGSGLAMVLALLIAAIAWNLGTWYLGLPASSSHTLIGAILGVGLANSAAARARASARG